MASEPLGYSPGEPEETVIARITIEAITFNG
jgi:hypothetical protein